MNINQVAAQTYTIRDSIKTEQGFRDGCRKLAEIGYQAIELALVSEEIPARKVADICLDNGLTITSSMEDFASMLDAPESLIDKLTTFGCDYVVYGWPHDTDFKCAQSRQNLITRLRKAARVFKSAGITLLYHNHALEFRKVDGRVFLDILFENLDSDQVLAELDTYWIQRGGADPEDWCRKLSGRLPILHLKDMVVYEGNDSTFGEIGAGNLDFKSIITAAEESGCRWFAVEQDMCPGDPFDSLKQSFDYIKANLVNI